MQGKASHYFPLSIVHGVRNQQENDVESVMPGKAFLKAFWNSECLLQNILHLKFFINCCFVDATGQYSLQTTIAAGVGGLFLAFYLFLGYLDLRGSQKQQESKCAGNGTANWSYKGFDPHWYGQRKRLCQGNPLGPSSVLSWRAHQLSPTSLGLPLNCSCTCRLLLSFRYIIISVFSL